MLNRGFETSLFNMVTKVLLPQCYDRMGFGTSLFNMVTKVEYSGTG